jgi:hypothetical protein
MTPHAGASVTLTAKLRKIPGAPRAGATGVIIRVVDESGVQMYDVKFQGRTFRLREDDFKLDPAYVAAVTQIQKHGDQTNR